MMLQGYNSMAARRFSHQAWPLPSHDILREGQPIAPRPPACRSTGGTALAALLHPPSRLTHALSPSSAFSSPFKTPNCAYNLTSST